jgi:hypothetical protein
LFNVDRVVFVKQKGFQKGIARNINVFLIPMFAVEMNKYIFLLVFLNFFDVIYIFEKKKFEK